MKARFLLLATAVVCISAKTLAWTGGSKSSTPVQTGSELRPNPFGPDPCRTALSKRPWWDKRLPGVCLPDRTT